MKKPLLDVEKMGILWSKYLLSNIFIFMHDYHGTSVMGAFYELKKEILQIKWDQQQLLGIWSDKRAFYSILFFKITGVQNNTTLVKSDSLKVCNVMRKVLENECILHGVNCLLWCTNSLLESTMNHVPNQWFSNVIHIFSSAITIRSVPHFPSLFLSQMQSIFLDFSCIQRWEVCEEEPPSRFPSIWWSAAFTWSRASIGLHSYVSGL